MFDKLDAVVDRYEELTEKLADPTIYDRQDEFKKISSERANLEEIVQVFREYKQIKEDIEEAKEILKNEKDEDMREMAKEVLSENEGQIAPYEERLTILLLPKDPLDDKNVIVEIRAGAGGDEASIFVGDVFRMYQNYIRDNGWKHELISISEGDEGIKEVIFSVTGDKVYSKLKYESGVHRVQRVPKTESQGRVHTSTITVAILPEADEVDFKLDLNEVRIDVYRSSGAGGQSVNTTDSAVRVTHEPTNTVVACQDERSQLKNKEKALKILAARIYDEIMRKKHEVEAAERKGLVGTGDRSERIRTYNFPQGRLSDHRIGLTLYSLDKIIEGDLAPVVDALIAHNQAELLKGQEE
ncbi:peptide chain release factor 1 [Halobacteriovorax sp. GB3]|uniref:peptide chain release factor 1 n=1 Tax=Halobacteriovorax sp. GB3 TaxID=2719615 RepID=UPI0023627DDF|nr:peptide chain release factor 1 [Halobacteriovorax sp. GB3]MDD0854048.1 peptide chain release factor 1 [Halobacteriovorax sp. GB3]